MLHLLDLLFVLLHCLIIGFNLFGWFLPTTRKAHLVLVILTASSWFLLGIFFGIGYCPITDWHWQVKSKLGENNLPASFIEYYAEKITGLSLNSDVVNLATLVAFLTVAMISVYLNFIIKTRRHTPTFKSPEKQNHTRKNEAN